MKKSKNGIRNLIFLATFILVGVVGASAQQLTPEQIANQRLGKAMDVIASQDAQIKADADEKKAAYSLVDRLLDQNKQLMEQNTLLVTQNRDLSKLKCSDFAFLDFHIIKIGHIKRCK